MGSADESQRLFGNNELPHLFSVRHNLATALLKLGNNEEHFNQAIIELKKQIELRDKDSNISEENKIKYNKLDTKKIEEAEAKKQKVTGVIYEA